MNEPFSCALCHANEYREAVDRDFSALSAAGFALVPLEATGEQTIAYRHAARHAVGRWVAKAFNAAIAEGNILKGDGE